MNNTNQKIRNYVLNSDNLLQDNNIIIKNSNNSNIRNNLDDLRMEILTNFSGKYSNKFDIKEIENLGKIKNKKNFEFINKLYECSTSKKNKNYGKSKDCQIFNVNKIEYKNGNSYTNVKRNNFNSFNYNKNIFSKDYNECKEIKEINNFNKFYDDNNNQFDFYYKKDSNDNDDSIYNSFNKFNPFINRKCLKSKSADMTKLRNMSSTERIKYNIEKITNELEREDENKVYIKSHIRNKSYSNLNENNKRKLNDNKLNNNLNSNNLNNNLNNDLYNNNVIGILKPKNKFQSKSKTAQSSHKILDFNMIKSAAINNIKLNNKNKIINNKNYKVKNQKFLSSNELTYLTMENQNTQQNSLFNKTNNNNNNYNNKLTDNKSFITDLDLMKSLNKIRYRDLCIKKNNILNVLNDNQIKPYTNNLAINYNLKNEYNNINNKTNYKDINNNKYTPSKFNTNNLYENNKDNQYKDNYNKSLKKRMSNFEIETYEKQYHINNDCEKKNNKYQNYLEKFSNKLNSIGKS